MTENNGWQLTDGADPSTVEAYYTEQTPDGSAAYYENRYTEHIEKYNTRPPDYYLGYGHKYNARFNNETKNTLSEAGKKWLDQTSVELQVLIEGALRDNPSIELNSEIFQKFAFESHVPAYSKGNLLFSLPDGDKVKIGLTPDFKDLFSPLGIKQAWKIMDMMGKYDATGKYNKVKQARPFE